MLAQNSRPRKTRSRNDAVFMDAIHHLFELFKSWRRIPKAGGERGYGQPGRNLKLRPTLALSNLCCRHLLSKWDALIEGKTNTKKIDAMGTRKAPRPVEHRYEHSSLQSAELKLLPSISRISELHYK